jgi:hypothetical protein
MLFFALEPRVAGSRFNLFSAEIVFLLLGLCVPQVADLFEPLGSSATTASPQAEIWFWDDCRNRESRVVLRTLPLPRIRPVAR